MQPSLDLLNSLQPRSTTVLCELMTKYGSDKATKHNYSVLYHGLFQGFRDQPLRVFELGIGSNDTKQVSNMGQYGRPGASLRGWAQYFPQATVFGADIDRKTLFREDRIATFHCDQTSPESIQQMWREVGPDKMDIIIEDGLHTFEANVCFFENSLHMLSPTGIFIVEDLTSQTAKRFRAKINDQYRDLLPHMNFLVVDLPGRERKAHDNRLFVAWHRQAPY